MKCLFLPGLLLCSMLCYAQHPLFDSMVAYPVKDKVRMFQVKDITGDGVADLTTMYPAVEDRFGILAGKGNGSFGAERLLTKPVNYFRNDVADLNKDGFPELIISSYWDNGFRIYYGNAAGRFDSSVYMPTDVHGREIRCTDINKDGHIDIIATTSGSGRTISLHVFINKGDGTFHPKQSYPSMLDTCTEIFFTDKNNDGLMDVVVSSAFPWLLFYYQQPDGSFVAKYRPTYTTARVAFGDVNQDNRDDLILLYSSFDNMPGSDSMLVLLNTGDMAFAVPYKVPQFGSNKIRPTQVRMADINNDGLQDMIVNQLDMNGDYDDTVFYMTGKPNAGFNEPVAVALPANVLYTQLVDIDKDGYIDLVASCDNKTIYTVFNNRGKATAPTAELLVYPNPTNSRIFLKGLPAGRHNIALYSANGILLRAVTISGKWWSLPVEHLPAGTYYLHVSGQGIDITRGFRKM
jgi:hypothetical protein